MTCTTHHDACDCREAAHRNAIIALERENNELKRALADRLMESEEGNEYSYVIAMKNRVAELEFLLEGAQKELKSYIESQKILDTKCGEKSPNQS